MCDTCMIEGWADEETTPTAYIAQLDTEETRILEHAETVIRTAPKATWNDDGTVHWYSSPLHVQIDDGNYDMDGHEHDDVRENNRWVKGPLKSEPELTIVRTWNELTDIQRLYLCTKIYGLLHSIDEKVTETIARWQREEAEEIAETNTGNPKTCTEIECPPFREVTLGPVIDWGDNLTPYTTPTP